jgi:hypothetical protein
MSKPKECNIHGGHGTCNTGVTPSGKRFCIGGDQLCGVNAHKPGSTDSMSCSDLLKQYPDLYKQVTCDKGYTAGFLPIKQGTTNSCLFTCNSPDKKMNIWLIIGIVIGVLVVLGGVFFMFTK